MAGIVVFDASALIALFAESDSHHSWALEMFLETAELNYQITALTLAEVLVYPIRNGLEQRVLSNLESLEIKVKDIPAGAALQLAKLRVETGLRMPDVVVLNQGIIANAAIATADNTLALSAQKLDLPVFSPNFKN